MIRAPTRRSSPQAGTCHNAPGTARHERSNRSKKSSGLLPEAEEAARIDQWIAGYLADLDATDASGGVRLEIVRIHLLLLAIRALIGGLARMIKICSILSSS